MTSSVNFPRPFSMRSLRPLALVAATLAAASLAAASASAQMSNEAVFHYHGPDREAKLAAQAKQEGKVVLYTSLAPSESKPLAEAFQKKYGIKVELWRALSDKVVQRAIAEARAHRADVDVIETNGPEMDMIANEQVLEPWDSPYLADLPAAAVPKGHPWLPDRMNFFVVGFNTDKVKRSEIPATYEGFLDPKWKGRIGIEATDEEWMATLVKTMGEEKGLDFFRKLAAMKPDMRKGHVLLAKLVSAGEVPVCLSCYNSNIISLKRKGAPVDFVPVQPVAARPQGIGIARAAPHPAAAVLFADFVLSPEGQKLYESMGRVPASTKVKSELNDFPFTMMDPKIVLEEEDKWQKLWDQLFLQR